ncbi:hypothetical protein [Roseovarius sp.]
MDQKAFSQGEAWGSAAQRRPKMHPFDNEVIATLAAPDDVQNLEAR